MGLTQVFSDIADAIREKSGSSDTYLPTEMAQAIEDIPSGGGVQIATGSFTSATTYDGKVEINVGFEPDIVYVEMAFGSGVTKAIAKKGMDSSLWDLRPIENNAYPIIMGSENGETGITDITSTGFKYRSHGGNTQGQACNYVAYKFN